jgi:hypothetical protein
LPVLDELYRGDWSVAVSPCFPVPATRAVQHRSASTWMVEIPKFTMRVRIGSKTLLKKILFTAHYRQAIFCVALR